MITSWHSNLYPDPWQQAQKGDYRARNVAESTGRTYHVWDTSANAWRFFVEGQEVLNLFPNGNGEFLIALQVTGILTLLSGFNINNTTLTGDTTINGTYCNVLGDTTSAAFTITLPASPTQGQFVRIVNIGTGSNLLTIDRNGNQLTGGTVNRTLSPGSVIILVYDSTKGWW
jgi:hypothetical protein